MEPIKHSVSEIREFEKLAEKFKAIGHPARASILHLLCNCGEKRLTVKSIYEALGLDQPSTSRHLNIMRKNEVLERTSEGGDTFYSLSQNDNFVDCIKTYFEK